MLSIYTIPEALAELASRTGRPWTQSHLFDVVLQLGLHLRGMPPLETKYTIWKIVSGQGLVAHHKGLSWQPGILYPIHVAQLWQVGQTSMGTPSVTIVEENAFAMFDPPVTIDVNAARVPADVLDAIMKREAAAAHQPLEAPKSSVPAAWIKTARTYAAETSATLRSGTRPTKVSLSKKVAERFKQEGIQGPRGQLTAQTIEREALRDWSPPAQKKT